MRILENKSDNIKSVRDLVEFGKETKADDSKFDDASSYYTAPLDNFCVHKEEFNQNAVIFDQSEISHFVLSWTNICYIVKAKKSLLSTALNFYELLKFLWFSKKSYDVQRNDSEDITILNNVCGSIRSGQLTAIMGASGAGKTSLLNCLSRRKIKGYSGQISTSHPYERRLKVSVIEQKDNILGTLTVKENLDYASRLRNPEKYFNHEENVDKVVRLLDLNECLHTRCSSISGGQIKRLLVAQELLSSPDILIMDEPTSGLDSLSCSKTISVLRNIVYLSRRQLLKPMAIVITIHQPQEDVFQMFDKIYCLSHGGTEIYDGQPNECKDILEQNTGIKMPLGYNPASFLIEFSLCRHGIESIEKLNKVVRFNFKSYSKNSMIRMPNSLKQSPSLEKNLQIDDRLAKRKSLDGSGFWYKSKILIRRIWTSHKNNPNLLILRLICHIFSPLAFVYLSSRKAGPVNGCPKIDTNINITDLFNEDKSDHNETMILTMENMNLLIIFSHSLMAISIGISFLDIALNTRRTIKEINNEWYSIPSYVFSRLLADIPIGIIFPAISVSILYPLSRQISSSYEWRQIMYSFAVIIGYFISQTVGCIFGTLFYNDIQTGLFWSQASLWLPILIAVLRHTRMSVILSFITKITFYRPILEIMLLARYGYNVCGNCNETIINELENIDLVGVPDKLRSFAQVYFFQNDDYRSDALLNNSSIIETHHPSSDIFQLFAKQISLSNNYGKDIKSCQDVIPIILREYHVDESLLLPDICKVVFTYLIAKLIFFVVVKLIVMK